MFCLNVLRLKFKGVAALSDRWMPMEAAVASSRLLKAVGVFNVVICQIIWLSLWLFGLTGSLRSLSSSFSLAGNSS